MSKLPARHPSGGFTLVEILVVLILTGFIVTILMQALHQVFRLQTHFGHEVFNTQSGAMYADWFRQSINGLVPDYIDGKQKFQGGRREMRGLTLAPLDQDTGTLTPFVWRLEYDPGRNLSALYYGESGDKKALQIMHWQNNNGRFIYVDAKDEAHDSWPPFLGKWPQLPHAIYLESGAGDAARVLVAAPRSAATTMARRKEVEAP